MPTRSRLPPKAGRVYKQRVEGRGGQDLPITGFGLTRLLSGRAKSKVKLPKRNQKGGKKFRRRKRVMREKPLKHLPCRGTSLSGGWKTSVGRTKPRRCEKGTNARSGYIHP